MAIPALLTDKSTCTSLTEVPVLVLQLYLVPVLLRADDGPSVDRDGALDEEDGCHHPEVGDGEYGAEVAVQGHELVSDTLIE